VTGILRFVLGDQLDRDGAQAGARRATEPGEWRVLDDMRGWAEAMGVPVEIRADDHFRRSTDELARWAGEGVELPDTPGMAMHADGGYVGSEPYAASGNDITRMSDFCRRCRYDVAGRTAPKPARRQSGPFGPGRGRSYCGCPAAARFFWQM
jgi:deoxyribodipyrimidine photolyase-like uncharacterized protein